MARTWGTNEPPKVTCVSAKLLILGGVHSEVWETKYPKCITTPNSWKSTKVFWQHICHFDQGFGWHECLIFRPTNGMIPFDNIVGMDINCQPVIHHYLFLTNMPMYFCTLCWCSFLCFVWNFHKQKAKLPLWKMYDNITSGISTLFNIAMENHHFKEVNLLFLWAIYTMANC